MSKQVEVNGQYYSSVAAFIRENRIPANKYITILKELQGGIPAEDIARKYAFTEEPSITNRKSRGRATPCIIDGKKFASKSEACDYYGVKYVTINTRMKRKNITFEEAILRRKDSNFNSPWIDLNLVPTNIFSNEAAAKVLQQFITAGRTIQQLGDTHQNIDAIRFADDLTKRRHSREIMILVKEGDDGLYDIVYVIPELAVVHKALSKNSEVLTKINRLNQQIMGVKLTLYGGKVIASKHMATSKHVQKRQVLSAYQHLLDASAIAYNRLCKLQLVL